MRRRTPCSSTPTGCLSARDAEARAHHAGRRLGPSALALLALFFGRPAWSAAPPCRYTIEADTVLDNDTGLLWQRAFQQYASSWDGAIAYCAGLDLGGYSSGWRLPEVKELNSLVDYGVSLPSIDTAAFPGLGTGCEFWSASVCVNTGTTRWGVSFGTGLVQPFSPGDANKCARCVRSPSLSLSSASQSDFEKYTARVLLSLAARRGVEVSVPYTLTGTATAGVDYTVSPASPITVPAGQTEATITFTLIDDATSESDETAILTLGTPTGALLGATTAHTLTIRDSACAADREWWEWPFPPENKPDSLYTWTADTVYDTVTGLTWQRSIGGAFSWGAAQTYCQNLSLEGTGWRLPTYAELRSIVRYDQSPSINTTAFVDTGNWTWSGTPIADASGCSFVVYFGNGSGGCYDATASLAARCVR